MEKEGLKNNNSTSSSGPTNHHRERVGLGIRTGDGPSNGGRSLTETRTTTPSEFFLQWGIRKRLRCMKIQMKDGSITPVSRKTVRVDRRVVRADKNGPAQTITTTNNGNGGGGYFNLPQQAPPPIPLSNRVLRNSEGMRGQGNGAVEQRAHDKKGGHNHSNHHHHNNNNSDNNNNNLGGVCSGASSENNRDSKKGGSSGSEALPAVWPPKFVIALTNKEKEEDFMVLKGSKLPQRPKKRTKFLQRTLNLVSPGSWLCDLTLERYEVREKKTSKKRPRGLKAMNNMESDSE